MLGEVIENILANKVSKVEINSNFLNKTSTSVNLEYLKSRLKQLQLNKLANKIDNVHLDEQTYSVVNELLDELEKRAFESSTPFMVTETKSFTKVDPITKFVFGG